MTIKNTVITLEVNEEGIEIGAATREGIFNGIGRSSRESVVEKPIKKTLELLSRKLNSYMNVLSSRLKLSIDKNVIPLKKLDIHSVEKKSNPDKWSKKEILGHLIDSAANNHCRFVRIQTQEDLVFEGYDQAEWVNLQGYQIKNWDDIVNLWYQYNDHLVEVIGLMSEEVLG